MKTRNSILLISALVLISNCNTQQKIISPYSFRTEVNKLGEDMFYAYHFDSLGQGIYGYNFKADSVYELISPSKDYYIFEVKMGVKDSVLYCKKMLSDSTRTIQLIKLDLSKNSYEIIFDKSFLNYGLAKNDSLLVFTSALAYGTSSPVNNVPIAYNQKVYSYNLYSKEFNRIGEKLNYDQITEFYVYSDLDLLFMSNYNSDRISFSVDPKGYVKYDLRDDTYEYFVNIRNEKKKIVTQLYMFDSVYEGLDNEELINANYEYLYRYNFSTKTGREFFNYKKQKGIKSEDSYQINNVRPLVNKNAYLLSVINAENYELIYVIIDMNGNIVKEFLPDMSEFKSKYSRSKQFSRD